MCFLEVSRDFCVSSDTNSENGEEPEIQLQNKVDKLLSTETDFFLLRPRIDWALELARITSRQENVFFFVGKTLLFLRDVEWKECALKYVHL